MKSISTALAALSGLTLVANASALNLPALRTVFQAAPTLYSSTRSIADQKIKLRSWGSGLIAETEDAAFEGTNSLRITSRNFFQGGTLVYEEPVNLSSAFEERTNLLRLVYQPLGAVTGGRGDQNGRPGGGFPGGPGGLGAPGGPGGRGGALGGPQGGGPRGGGTGTGGPGGGGSGGVAVTAPTLRNVRLVVTTTDNLRSEAYVPVATSISTRDGWRQVGIPLKAIRGFDRTNKTIKEITVASDSTGAFYLGDLRVVSDPTPIRAEVNERNLNLALNDIATLTAQGEGGSSVLRYTWDFDDKDGITVDAEGAAITHKFRKPGTFTVTVTVQDEYGLKDPYTTTIQVKVNG